MDKREALEIYLKLHNECMENEDCFTCPFGEYYRGIKFCVLSHPDDDVIVKLVEDKLKRISEAPEQKTTVPLENVGGIIIKPNEHTRKLIDEAIKEHSEKIKDWVERGNIATEIVMPKGVERGVLPSSVVKNDNVNHPKHYCKGGVESIDFVKAAVSNLSGFEAVCVANIIKYMWRYKEKNGLEDVMKAGKYLEWLQEEVGKNANKA